MKMMTKEVPNRTQKKKVHQNFPSLQLNTSLLQGYPSQFRKARRKNKQKNKRKNVLTPPEDPKDSKLARRGETPEGSPSLVTKLIRKYSSTEVHEDGENGVPSEDKEASITEGLQISPSTSSSSSLTSRSSSSTPDQVSSPLSSVDLSGSVIPPGVK